MFFKGNKMMKIVNGLSASQTNGWLDLLRLAAARRLLMCGVACSALVMGTTPLLAQSTGTQEIETVVVTAEASVPAGLGTPEKVSKERSTITQEYLDTQAPGQTLFQSLNMVPGLNFTNSDPYGSSGGNLRLHGQEGARISFTWDGMPLNDTGNYAIFTNQVVDPELVDKVAVNQGTTDVDSPTASSIGGVINIVTSKPLDDFHILGDLSQGSFAQQRYFVRVDSGTFGPWDTKAFLTVSYQHYDKFKGPPGDGYEQKRQINGGIYQDFGNKGFFYLLGHFNDNRNYFYNNVSFLPLSKAQATSCASGGLLASTACGDPSSVSSPNVVFDNNGSYTGTTTGDSHGDGMNRDNQATCSRGPGFGDGNEATSVGGTTAICTDWYRLRANPSDTGNIRAKFLWHLTDDLTFTLDPSFQYVLANGGGVTVMSEKDPRLGPSGKSLNGDADTTDAIMLYTPNNTNTRRYGVTSSMIYQYDDDNALQVAYTLDWGLHRQTANYATFDGEVGPFDPFAGLKDKVHRVTAADGTPIRGRDRKSYAILNQVSADYEGRFFDDLARVSLGMRLPFFQRDLNQFCYLQMDGSFTQTTPGVGFQYCTSETPSGPPDVHGAVTFAGLPATALFTPPGSKVVRFSKFLPSAGLTLEPFGAEHQFFGAFAKQIAVPRTDNLYNGGVTGFDPSNASPSDRCDHTVGCMYHTFAVVRPETSTSFSLGYRFTGDWVHGSVTLWNTQYQHRIVSSFDPEQGVSIDHDVGTVNTDGVDVEAGADPIENLNLYGAVSYFHSRVVKNLQVGFTPPPCPPGCVPIFLPTAGKELVESPNWMISSRAQYKIEGFRLGLQGKYVGRRFATDTNDYKVPSYLTADADLTYDLESLGFGWTGSYVKLDVQNIFDKSYFASVATSRSCFTPFHGAVTSGCTSYPLLSVGAPRTFEFSVRAEY
jgi:iron complex outermembrane receptor protein